MNQKSDSSEIDLDYRPKSYHGAPGSLEELVAQIKGSASRAMARGLIDQGRGDEVARLVETLTPEVIQMLEATNPAFMGGNYLPPLAASETEVARITLESTTADVKAVYAQPTDDGWIRYKVVDEYGDEESLASSTALRPEPMALGEFADFFLDACGLVATLEDNFGDDLEQALTFFAGESDFYPGLDRLCRVKICDVLR